MDVIVDKNRIPMLSPVPEDVLSAVVALSDLLRTKGRAILKVQVDGTAVAADELVEQLQGKRLDEVAVLEIDSEELSALVQACLTELKSTLPELPQACHDLAAVFQSEQPQDGYEPFQKLADIWSHVKSREIQVSRALDVSLDALQLDGVPISRMHESLNDVLKDAAEALEAGDCILLGDLLEYELAPRAEAEARIVAMLEERARRRSV